MSKPYECKLDAATQEKAKNELNEDPKNRQGAIDTFRKWIQEQKHIKCPTDDVFLLAFLRARKFSQLEARRQLENFMKRREKLPEWFKDLDPTDEKLTKVIDDAVAYVLPGTDKEGRKVFVFKIGNIDMSDKKYTKNDFFRLFVTVLDYLYLCDEWTQVHGTVTIIDFSNMTFAHQTKITMEDRKNFLGTWQKNYPARIKGVHMYNLGSFMEFIMMVIKMAMSEKVQKRIIIHSHGLETLYKSVPESMLPDEYLADDYNGPSAGPEKKLIEQLKADFKKPEIRDRIKYLSSKEFSIDMKAKDSSVPEASFRKLNVD